MAITESSCRAFRDFCGSLAAIDIDTARLTFFPGAEKKLPANEAQIWPPIAPDTSLGERLG